MDIALSNSFITLDPKIFTKKIYSPCYEYFNRCLDLVNSEIDNVLINLHIEYLKSLSIVNIKSSLDIDPHTIYKESIKDYNSIKRISPSM